MKTPDPEQLRELLEAALAVMEPNDPAREELKVDATLTANGRAFFSVYFFFYCENPRRDCHVNGRTAQEAIEAFKIKYTPPPTKENRIAALRAELAKMEGAES